MTKKYFLMEWTHGWRNQDKYLEEESHYFLLESTPSLLVLIVRYLQYVFWNAVIYKSWIIGAKVRLGIENDSPQSAFPLSFLPNIIAFYNRMVWLNFAKVETILFSI